MPLSLMSEEIRINAEKAQFIRAWINRTAPTEEADVIARIRQAEKIWEILETQGYGSSTTLPAPLPRPVEETGWDGLPKPKLSGKSGFHPAHTLVKLNSANVPNLTREQWLREEAHWQKLHNQRLQDETFLEQLNQARAALGKPLLEPAVPGNITGTD